MMLEKALDKAGLSLEGDKLPKGSRTQKDFQRLIAAVRAAESGVLDRLSESERELNEQLRANLELQERNHKLETELKKYKVNERLQAIESLTTSDRTKLLELAAA